MKGGDDEDKQGAFEPVRQVVVLLLRQLGLGLLGDGPVAPGHVVEVRELVERLGGPD